MSNVLLVLDSNAIDACALGGQYSYLRSKPAFKLVPVRLARDESERAKVVPQTPLPREMDAPVPMVLNDPACGLNDPGVVLWAPRMTELQRVLEAVYKDPKKHQADILNIAYAVNHGEEQLQTGCVKDAYFVTGDRGCCAKAAWLVNHVGSPVGVLYARQRGAREVQNVRELGMVFPP